MQGFLFFLVLAVISRPIEAKPIGKAIFTAEGEGLAIDIEGSGAIVDADVKSEAGKLSGVFKVKVSEFKTGIDLRDEHMRTLLKVDKNPYATFTLDPIDQKDGKQPFKGTMEFNGVKKPFSGEAEIAGGKVKAKGTLKLLDHGITPPTYKIAKVSNSIEVTVELSL